MNERTSFQHAPQGEAPGPLDLYLQDLAEPSRRTQRQALNVVAGMLSAGKHDAAAFPWWELTYPDASRARSYVVERYAPSTARRIVAAIRGVLKRSWRLGLMTAEAYRQTADLEPVRGSRLPPGRGVTPGELRALFNVCRADNTPRGARDAALLALLYSAGLRRAEAAAVSLGDFDPGEGLLLVEGKGRRQRRIPIARATWEAIRAWLEVRGDRPGPLFLSVNNQGALRGSPITPQAIYQLARRRGAQAGVREFSPHDMRRSFVGDLLDAGADLATVQRLCGHSETGTTARYDRRDQHAMRTAVDLLHVPYSPTAPTPHRQAKGDCSPSPRCGRPTPRHEPPRYRPPLWPPWLVGPDPAAGEVPSSPSTRGAARRPPLRPLPAVLLCARPRPRTAAAEGRVSPGAPGMPGPLPPAAGAVRACDSG